MIKHSQNPSWMGFQTTILGKCYRQGAYLFRISNSATTLIIQTYQVRLSEPLIGCVTVGSEHVTSDFTDEHVNHWTTVALYLIKFINVETQCSPFGRFVLWSKIFSNTIKNNLLKVVFSYA